jgi:hypothetical protein
MKQILFLLLCSASLFAQKELHFDTFLHYEYQQDTLKKNVIFLTSKKFPNHTARIWNTQKDSSEIMVLKFDKIISLSYVNLHDFLAAENVNLISKIDYDDDIKDYQYQHKHYQFKEISKNPNICFEFVPTLSQRQIKKKKIKQTQIELLPNSENEIMFCDGSVLKWLMSQQSKDFHGIPSKITYLNPENGAVTSTLVLVEKIDISKNILLEKIESKFKVIR